MMHKSEQQNFNQLSEVINEYNRLHIAQQLDYDKFYLYSIITHSTAIEGSTVTEIENQLLFEKGISAHKPIYEQLMNLDLKAAYEKSFEFAKNHIQITTEILCELSAIVMKNTGTLYNTVEGVFSSAKGQLRLLNVSAGRGGKSYMAWQKLPQKLEAFCDWLNAERKSIAEKRIEEKYAFSFLSHYKLVQMHPWADGNGRMSRLLMNFIQYEAGIVPSIIKKENRAEYIQSLASSQEKDDAADFLQFMFSHHIRNVSEQIEEYKTSLESGNKEMEVYGKEKPAEQKPPRNHENCGETTKIVKKNCGENVKTVEKVLALIRENPSITQRELSAMTGLTRRGIEWQLQQLKAKNIIRRVGADKGGYWEIVK